MKSRKRAPTAWSFRDCFVMKRHTIMNNMIRALVIAVLGASLTAFATAAPAKTGRKADKSNCGTTNAADSRDSKSAGRDRGQPEKNDIESERDQLIKQQDEEWLHNLQNLGN